MLLARGGFRVLLLDRDGFPSDHLSTHWIDQPGVARLEAWGLRQRLSDTGCPPITSISMDIGPFALRGTPPPAGQVAEAYCPRRTVLDKLLVEAAVEAGAELREHFSVQDQLQPPLWACARRRHGLHLAGVHCVPLLRVNSVMGLVLPQSVHMRTSPSD